MDVFGVNTPAAIPDLTDLPSLDSEHSKCLRSAVGYLRTLRQRFMHLNILRPGIDLMNEKRFMGLLVEDSSVNGQSYCDYLVNIHRFGIIN
jgi:hypothetical protein